MTKHDALIAEIEREFAGFAGSGGVLAKNLKTGEQIAVNAHDQTATASTIKTPILIELFRQVEAGTVDLEQKLAVTPATLAPGSGILRDLSMGVELSVRDLATLMIVVSDNTATNMMIDLVGLENVNRMLEEAGFAKTRILQRLDFPVIGHDARQLAVTTPANLAGIMEAIATGAILKPESNEAILEIMRRQHYVDLTPRYLPYFPFGEELEYETVGLRVANKTGGWQGMRADMALIEWPDGDGYRQYVIGIVTEGDPDIRFWAENAGDRVIGRVSRLIYEYFGGPDMPGVGVIAN